MPSLLRRQHTQHPKLREDRLIWLTVCVVSWLQAGWLVRGTSQRRRNGSWQAEVSDSKLQVTVAGAAPLYSIYVPTLRANSDLSQNFAKTSRGLV